ncbi:Presenilin-like membrane protease, A22 family [Natronoarchaeum philippinense]|uniref:Presenilin-like membrane protease, A22 family n=1 Tax=Natronoarchaeum philippinense TaxID=558529 RepID=A0A285N7M8_NATPI|nr:presenilin family intramembrane aspartyl protease PSH [Natronoarchaeum philippinense]SNZ03976.1 Presenilin-like membrane protease, A22 family [Natronoarchaeum philippinense]
MNDRARLYAAVAGTVLLFVLVQMGALALVEPFEQSNYQAVEDPTDPTNGLVFFGAILVATAGMLLIIKYDVEWLIRAFIIGTSAMLAWYVLAAIAPVGVVSVGGASVALVPVLAALAVAGGLLVYPEWYVIDAAGVLMGAGAAGMFGISFGLLPAILFLLVLAIYDAISVYGTEHMLTLAEGVMDLNVPVLFIIPTSLSYSFRTLGAGEEMTEDDADAAASEATDGGAVAESDAGDEPEEGHTDDDEIRDALYIGLGDAVMPTILVASAAAFIPVSAAPQLSVPVVTLNLPALTAMLGTLTGLLILLRMVLKGRPHAGLPLLNGGTILGYLIGALASGITLAQAVGIASF